LPYKTSSLHVSTLWHERNANDETQEWLRAALMRATEALRVRLIEEETVALRTKGAHRTVEVISFPRTKEERQNQRQVDAL
jgi:hypothetical protein